jgi:hypothetical protein
MDISQGLLLSLSDVNNKSTAVFRQERKTMQLFCLPMLEQKCREGQKSNCFLTAGSVSETIW